MDTIRQSWGTAEERILTEIAKWNSIIRTLPPRRGEEAALAEGALVTPAENGVTTVKIGMLRCEFTPPVNYSGHCEAKDDWMLVSESKFKLAVRSPQGLTRLRPLQVCPQNDEVAFLRSQALLPLSMQKLGLREGSRATDVSIDHLDVDDKLSNSLLTRFFDAKETTASLRIIGENFSEPFLRSVRDLQTAESISVVLDTILGLSAAYDITLGALHQEQEETFDLTSCYYDEQVSEDCSSKSDSLWVRKQVHHAARKCQTAAAATAEVANVGARIFVDLYTNPSEVPHAFQFKRDDKPARDVVEGPSGTAMDECSDEVDPASTTNLHFEQDGLISGPSSMVEEQKTSATQHHCNSVDSGTGADGRSLDFLIPLDGNQFKIGDMGDGTNPTGTLLRTDSFGSSWQSDFGNDTSSESSWEVVRPFKNESTVEDEGDVLGNEVSDAESLEIMLRDIDPFGKRECSPLINEFLSLKMNSATCSADDSDQEQSSAVQDGRETKVLERLASYSSSISSNWSDHDIPSSASSSAKKKRTSPLETLAEEPACDPDIARIYRSYVFRTVTEGNVLHWCSCKFNKSRCSIELRFQVGAFMEDDIATLSTGISRESPLYVEIFLDPTNVRESLLQGDVRVSANQGDPFGYRGSWNHTDAKTVALPPVAGLSCYIPHLVRQYLKQEVHANRASSGYKFPEGELITGLMQYVIAQLVFIKQSCCVCNHETEPDVLSSIVPYPCERNLCQALYGAWLGVAPPAVVELSTIEDWLMACFDEVPLYDAFMKHYMVHRNSDQIRTWDGMLQGTYKQKVERVAEVLSSTVLSEGNSWLKLVIPKPTVDDKSNKPNETARTAETPRGHVKTQPPKRRRTSEQLNDDVLRANSWAEHDGAGPQPASPPASPLSTDDFDMGKHHDDVPTFEFEYSRTFVFGSAPTTIPARRDFPGPNLRSLIKNQQSEENSAHTSAFSLYGTSSTAQQRDSSSFTVASAGPPGQARGETSSTSQSDQGWDWVKMLERRASSHAPRMTRMSAQAAPAEQSKSSGKRIHGESSSHDPVPESWEDWNAAFDS